jgi:hypothetical protein
VGNKYYYFLEVLSILSIQKALLFDKTTFFLGRSALLFDKRSFFEEVQKASLIKKPTVF